ncbi:diacylglycerol kinase [Suicoccus acidiformans]|uniref:Diacylglycerol kinase n=1 Tax=Suicoccus acidiformans TaxID=2036206 RepID=A0A347WLG3_9LACT|nr:diacylglycerol kinase family protein [Suicoccus acidiformans]AXY25920.1 diacylglycerol kinase [Suicoccus acidiformans]
MASPVKASLKKFIKSCSFAISGIYQAFQTERNLRIELCIGLLTIGAGFYFQITLGEWLAVLLASGLVLSAELFNSAIETVVDLVAQGQELPLAKRAKDIAAGAVLLAALTAALIGLIIFIPYMKLLI